MLNDYTDQELLTALEVVEEMCKAEPLLHNLIVSELYTMLSQEIRDRYINPEITQYLN